MDSPPPPPPPPPPGPPPWLKNSYNAGAGRNQQHQHQIADPSAWGRIDYERKGDSNSGYHRGRGVLRGTGSHGGVRVFRGSGSGNYRGRGNNEGPNIHETLRGHRGSRNYGGARVYRGVEEHGARGTYQDRGNFRGQGENRGRGNYNGRANNRGSGNRGFRPYRGFQTQRGSAYQHGYPQAQQGWQAPAEAFTRSNYYYHTGGMEGHSQPSQPEQRYSQLRPQPQSHGFTFGGNQDRDHWSSSDHRGPPQSQNAWQAPEYAFNQLNDHENQYRNRNYSFDDRENSMQNSWRTPEEPFNEQNNQDQDHDMDDHSSPSPQEYGKPQGQGFGWGNDRDEHRLMEQGRSETSDGYSDQSQVVDQGLNRPSRQTETGFMSPRSDFSDEYVEERQQMHASGTGNPHLKRSFEVFAHEPDIVSKDKIISGLPCKRFRPSEYATHSSPTQLLMNWTQKPHIRLPLKYLINDDLNKIKGDLKHAGILLCKGKLFKTNYYFEFRKEARKVVADAAGWWLCYGSQFEEWEHLEGDIDDDVTVRTATPPELKILADVKMREEKKTKAFTLPRLPGATFSAPPSAPRAVLVSRVFKEPKSRRVQPHAGAARPTYHPPSVGGSSRPAPSQRASPSDHPAPARRVPSSRSRASVQKDYEYEDEPKNKTNTQHASSSHGQAYLAPHSAKEDEQKRKRR